MKYRKFQQNKLWRDKVVDKTIAAGSKIHLKYLNDEAFLQELKKKFTEESHEVINTTTKENLIEEFADILELIKTFGLMHNFSLQDVENIQKKKYAERGGFEGRKFVIFAEHPIGSFAENYCLQDPEKYPEIKD